jgi:hypothetical protein
MVGSGETVKDVEAESDAPFVSVMVTVGAPLTAAVHVTDAELTLAWGHPRGIVDHVYRYDPVPPKMEAWRRTVCPTSTVAGVALR